MSQALGGHTACRVRSHTATPLGGRAPPGVARRRQRLGTCRAFRPTLLLPGQMEQITFPCGPISCEAPFSPSPAPRLHPLKGLGLSKNKGLATCLGRKERESSTHGRIRKASLCILRKSARNLPEGCPYISRLFSPAMTTTNKEKQRER